MAHKHPDQIGYRFKRLRKTVRMMLTRSMEERGTKSLPFSVFILISPGIFPNQLNAPGAKCSIAPMANNTPPAIMIQRAIGLPHSFSNRVIVLWM